MSIRVRRGHARDLDAIVTIHLRAFAGFFLSSLGYGFLSELYRGFLHNAAGLVLVADIDGRIVGFAAGTLAPERFFRDLLRARWFAFGWAATGAALRRPQTVLPRLLSALRYRGEQPPTLLRAALLSSIAVEPQTSRSGIGSSLLSAYCNEAWTEGLEYVYLTTDRDANEPVNHFYLRHGFTVESEIRRRGGRVMIRYVCTRDRVRQAATT